MSDTLLSLQSGSLPEGTCWPANPQSLFDLWASLSKAVFPGTFGLFNLGNDVPTPDNRDKPWLRTDAQGNFDRIYTFGGYGAWTSPHPVPASSDVRVLWLGTENDLKTYEGGVDELVTPTTGPFWEVDHDFDFRTALGPGTSPAPTSTTVTVGDTGGAENEKLIAAQLPEHQHIVPVAVDSSATTISPSRGATVEYGIGANQASGYTLEATGNNARAYPLTSAAGEPVADQSALSKMPPFKAAFYIKRTARQFYTVF